MSTADTFAPVLAGIEPFVRARLRNTPTVRTLAVPCESMHSQAGGRRRLFNDFSRAGAWPATPETEGPVFGKGYFTPMGSFWRQLESKMSKLRAPLDCLGAMFTSDPSPSRYDFLPSPVANSMSTADIGPVVAGIETTIVRAMVAERTICSRR
jgi:hypothetical protein